MKYLLENNNTEDKFYMRDTFKQIDINYIIGQNIYEYDMKDAGFSLIKEYEQLPKSEITKLAELPKDRRKVTIGKIMKTNREFNLAHTKSFGMMRKRFINENGLDKSDILSIRKDAIFVIGKKCNSLKFGELTFAEKNRYTSYHKYGELEFLYRGSNNMLHVKGISDDVFESHNDHMIKYLTTVYRYLETKNTERLILFLKKFNHMYKSKTLPVGYYRELNSTSKFLINPKLSDYSVYMIGHVSENELDQLDISHNYVNIILPLMQRHYFTAI